MAAGDPPELITDENGILVASARHAKKDKQGPSRRPLKTCSGDVGADSTEVDSESRKKLDADVDVTDSIREIESCRETSKSAASQAGSHAYKPARRRRFTGPRFTSKRQLNMNRSSRGGQRHTATPIDANRRSR